MVTTMLNWSPDGKKIAFQGFSPAQPLLRIFVIPAEGGTPQPLLAQDSESEDDANWSPDGNSLIFERSPLLGSTNPNDFMIQRFDLKTRQTANLLGATGLFGPRWSPDGSHICALTADEHKLMLFQVEKGEWSELATGKNLEYPNWSRDGQYVYFESSGEHENELFRVNIATRKRERLLGFKGIARPQVAFGAEWDGLTPDGWPLIMHDVGTREIYALTLELP